MNTTFKRIISMALICMMMIGTLAGFSVSADEAATTVEIVSNNVQYGESLKLMYAVKAPAGSNVKVTITDAQGNVYNTVADGTVTVDGVECYKFVSEYGVPAQNIDAQFTATATVEGTEASDSQTYSVLQYLWERLYVSTNATAEKKAMYNALIEYAKAADVVLNKEAVSSIANLTYVVINGEGAMYNIGDEVELITDLVAGEGQEIVWTLNGETYTEATYVVTNAFANFVATVAGDVVEPEEPTPEEPEWTVADALQAAEGTEVVLTGTVTGIYQAYSEQYGNISVYITDEAGDRILAFRMTGKVCLGDVITVTGKVTLYGDSNQLAQGCTFEMVEAHNCEEYLNEATCETPATCSSCETTFGEALGHTEPNAENKCDRCGVNFGASYATETMSIIANQGTVNGKSISWTGSVVTFTNNQAASSNAIRTSDTNHFRIYAGSEVVISATNKMTKIEITAQSSSYATALKNSIKGDGVTVTVSGSVVTITFDEGVSTFTIAKMSAQARITAISVTYEA